jgi:hypothetical protein
LQLLQVLFPHSMHVWHRHTCISTNSLYNSYVSGRGDTSIVEQLQKLG